MGFISLSLDKKGERGGRVPDPCNSVQEVLKRISNSELGEDWSGLVYPCTEIFIIICSFYACLFSITGTVSFYLIY